MDWDETQARWMYAYAEAQSGSDEMAEVELDVALGQRSVCVADRAGYHMKGGRLREEEEACRGSDARQQIRERM